MIMQKGFTLIELMIVVAIIGILSMIAMPSYQDYTKRTYVAEGMALANVAKIALVEYFALNAKWPRNNEVAGLPDGREITGQAVESIKVNTDGDNGYVTVVFTEKVARGALTLKSNDDGSSIKWTCSGKNVAGKYMPEGGTSSAAGLRIKWLPANCRNDLVIA